MTAATYQYVDLPDASVVTTRALLTARENITDTVAARAMMCIHGGAGFGKTLAVNTCLRALAPGPGPPGPRWCAPDGAGTAPGARGCPGAGQASAARGGRGRPDAGERAAAAPRAGPGRGTAPSGAGVWGAGLFVRRELPFSSCLVDDFGGARRIQVLP
ncbi:hypothetical protein ACE1SV_63510 [Streptomyces sp. E-15]